ncbi:Sec-independent protein translocase protein TATB, chloroplastic, partial [Linum perenne]
WQLRALLLLHHLHFPHSFISPHESKLFKRLGKFLQPMAMATLIITPNTASTRSRLLLQRPPCSAPSYCPNFGRSNGIPQQSSSNLPQWTGSKHLGISFSPTLMRKGRKGKRKGTLEARASLFGVGAPEALVIGVVALLVFGPKGLAEVARNLGKTLRAFQPTIRELQEVSREFKSTLEKEIGLDDITSSTTQTTNFSNRTPTAPGPPSSPFTSPADSPAEAEPNGTPMVDKAYTSEEYLKVTEEQLKAAGIQQQAEVPAAFESQPQADASAAFDSQPEAKPAEEQLKANGDQQQEQTLVSAESQVKPENES